MTGTHSPVVAVLFVALLGWTLYRRYRRTVGRQPLVPRRLMVQISLLGLVTLLFLALAPGQPLSAVAGLAGLLAGGAVGLLGLHHTKFERRPDRDFYTPNTYLGLGIFALFLARLAYRYVQVSAQMQAMSVSGVPPSAASFGSLTSSPLTVALLLVVFGYYLVYESGLLLWTRRNPPGQAIDGGFRQPRFL